MNRLKHPRAPRDLDSVQANGVEYYGEVVPDDLSPMYGEGARRLQDQFDSRRLADRLAGVTLHDELTDDDVALIERQSSMLIATVDAHGWPDASYKGGDAGFVRIIDRRTIEFPSFDGNGMFRTIGNIADNSRLALLFVDQSAQRRLRLHGSGEVLTDASAVNRYPGAQAVVRIAIGRLFPNCGRYIHGVDGELSEFVPHEGYEPPQPEWKSYDVFRDALPADRLANDVADDVADDVAAEG